MMMMRIRNDEKCDGEGKGCEDKKKKLESSGNEEGERVKKKEEEKASG